MQAATNYYGMLEIRHGDRWVSPFGKRELPSYTEGLEWIVSAMPSIDDYKFWADIDTKATMFRMTLMEGDSVIREKIFETRLILDVKEIH